MSELKSEYSKKLRELREAKGLIETLEIEAKKLYKKVIEDDARKINTGLNIESIRDYLCQEKDATFIGLDGHAIGLEGDYPWSVLELQDFLAHRGFYTDHILGQSIHYWILGESSDLKDLETAIKDAIENDSQPYIYTQELFIAWLITGQDPLIHWSEVDLEAAFANHNALPLLRKLPWPFSRGVKSELGSFPAARTEEISYEVQTFEWNGQLSEESPLRKLGYSVREHGLSISQRRSVLRDAFSGNSLNKYLTTAGDRARWGISKSAQRLYAIYGLISFLIKLQGPSKRVAKSKWLSDLEWLKQTFYDPKKMNFWSHTPRSRDQKRKLPPKAIVKTALNPSQAWSFPGGKRR